MKCPQSLVTLILVLVLVAPNAFVGEPVWTAPVLASHAEETDQQQEGRPAHAPDRLIVKFRSGVAPRSTVAGVPTTGHGSLDAILSAHNVRSATGLFSSTPLMEPAELAQIYILRLQPGTDLNQLIALLETDPSVEWAEPDYLAFAADTTPNDPDLPDQWGLARIQALAAWDITTGSATVPIAVVDSGIEFSHPDLSDKLWVNPGETAGNGLDDDNNGYIDDVNGWDFVNGDNIPADDNGHGTQVAGIAAASTNNAVGIAGVCWACRIMPVKVMDASGVANYSDIAVGVLYAAQKGAKVINLSLGGYSYSSALHAVVQGAVETHGTVIVAGAGNDNLESRFYPAAYDSVLAVAGTNQTDAKAALSNFGAWVDLSAPAVAIKTTFMGEDYGEVDGTSYAAPFVAGIAGLLRSQNPTWSPEMVRAQIIHTAEDIDSLNPGLEGLLGSGRVHADEAIRTAANPSLAIQGYRVDGLANGRPEPGSTVDLDIVLYNDWADAGGVQATLTSSDPYVSLVNGSASFGDIPAYGSGTSTMPFQFSVSASAPYAHSLDLTLNLTATGGYTVGIPLRIQTASVVVYPSATLTTETWTNDRIYVINKETGIPEGETLTIEPGTEIRFDGSFSLIVAGTLIADGTEEEPIRFTSDSQNPSPGDWMRIRFLDTATDATFDAAGSYIGGSILRHATVEFGHGVSLESAAPFLSHNTFRDNAGAGIVGTGSEGLTVTDNSLTGAYLDTTFVGMQLSISGGNSSIARNTVVYATDGILVSGSGVLTGNSVRESSGLGIGASGPLTVTANRVVSCGTGMFVDGGTVGGNLLAYNEGNGLQVNGGTPAVISNTIVANGQAGIYIANGLLEIHHNNLIAGWGGYALHNATASHIDATENWWGTAVETAIQEAIYDASDQFGLGSVDYGSYGTGPEDTAPAYVRNVVLTPPSPVGIEAVAFEVEFSRDMEAGSEPEMRFHSSRKGTWQTFTSDNSGLANDRVVVIAADPAGGIWFGTWGGGVSVLRVDGTWETYNPSNSGLASYGVTAIEMDGSGNRWFGTDGYGVSVLRADSTWQTYNRSNSGLVDDYVTAIAVDTGGNAWFGSQEYGVSVLKREGTWQTYDSGNSQLAHDHITAIMVDAAENKWFGTDGGGVSVLHADGAWQVFNASNSGLAQDRVTAIERDAGGNVWCSTDGYGVSVLRTDGLWRSYYTGGSHVMAIDGTGNVWLGHAGVVVLRADGSWQTYDTSNSGLALGGIRAIAADDAGNIWFGTYHLNLGAVSVLYSARTHPITDGANWLAPTRYRATYDISTLVPRDTYVLSISEARGTDGIGIAPHSGVTFTVDYAGAIGDTTPPQAPIVTACAGGTMDTLYGSWSASDPESEITLYSFAIGTTPGGGQVVNWTNTTATSLSRTDLNLVPDQPYYLAVKARNEGGLWSVSGVPEGLYAGSNTCTTNRSLVYLPLVLR